jgi:hypothetical protein
MSDVKPIRPEDIPERRAASVPAAVIESFNELIAENYKDGRSRVIQDEVVERIVAKSPDVEPATLRSRIYAWGWLDVEPFYRDAGWKVEYDKPGYNEDYKAYFVFRSK